MELINSIFGWPLGWIMWFCYLVVRNYGIALILFTLLTKLMLLPFAVKQQKSTIKMAIFKPKMDAIQKAYGNNKEKLNEELMKLYEKEGYNPMSGCMPMLIQFPILFGLIDVVYKPLTHILRLSSAEITIATDAAKGLMEKAANSFTAQLQAVQYIQSGDPAVLDKFSALSAETIQKIQSIDFRFLGIDLLKFPAWKMAEGQQFLPYLALLLIPILSGVTSLLLTLQQKHYNKSTQPQQGGMMNGMLYIMPIFSAYFAFMVPAGVGMYWLISNVLMMVQAFFLNKKFNPEETARLVKEAEEAEKERQRQEKIEAKKKLAEKAAASGKSMSEEEKEELRRQALSEKEAVAKKIAEARRRMEEKYGDAPSSDGEQEKKK
ncbi:MAG: YidC/Oxa1 family membrane protein insertase [Oscillospiraceae bacterium]|nr:YidC/Oxa1 family membrane protein insertase [Oscillospiraceae bacterium]